MKILAFTNLFPNRAEPARGMFNLQSFRALAEHCEELRVVAPARMLPRAYRCGDADVEVPLQETIEGITVYHPRYFLVPKVGTTTHALQMALWLTPAMERIRREYRFDVLLGTWAFPDLCAVAPMAKRWGVPLAAKVHGADINVQSRYPARRRMIVRALNQARIILSVTDAMKERMLEIGVPSEKILVQRNGVDQERFRIRAREDARREVGIEGPGPHLLYLGTFRPTKGLSVLIEALRQVVEGGVPATLHFVGDGRMETELRDQARAGGIEERLRFHGFRPHEAVPAWLSAADALVLPSLSDGCPNVILETLACGRPVVASRVGGIPEILSDDLGVLTEPGDATNLAAGIRKALGTDWDPQSLRASILQRSWARNAAEFYQALTACLPREKSGRVEELKSGPVTV